MKEVNCNYKLNWYLLFKDNKVIEEVIEKYEKQNRVLLGCYYKGKLKNKIEAESVIVCVIDNFKIFCKNEEELINRIIKNYEHEVLHYCFDKLKVNKNKDWSEDKLITKVIWKGN